MGFPICEICAKTGVLCSGCEEKLRKGEITKLEVELSKFLYKIGEGEIGFEKAIDTENFIIILTSKENIGKIIGKGGENIKQISKKFKKQVRVIGMGSLEEMIYDFVAPARIIGISTIYKRDGTVIRRVKIKKEDKKKLRMEVAEIEELVSSLLNDKVEVIFE
ncbi:MAG: transcription elongation factor NusA [Candidatus Altiarchaeales archaeon]|nr:MAG: transcription elongation factor NusA [Candidatus Altiarchaeales archaeon]